MTDEPLDLLEAEDVGHLASPLALGHRIYPNFRSRIHQKIISDAFVDAVSDNGPKRIAVSVPQQEGKSAITSVLAPANYLELFNYGVVPGGYIGLISAEDSLVLFFSNQIRRLISQNPDVFTTRLRKDSRAASFWETEPRELDGTSGGVIATGITGSIVGRPISLLVIDDPTKNAEQANSEKHREQVWNFYQSVGIGRLQPWSIVLVVCTRWSEDDLIGRLISKDYPGDPNEWRYIRIPAIADSEDDPCGRKIGDALLRPQHSGTQEEANFEMQKVKESVSDYYWETLWMQNPRDPEGTIWYERCWRYYHPKPTDENACYPLPAPKEFDQVVMSWDLSFKDTKDSDWVVGTAWGGIGADRYLLDLVRGRWSYTETRSRIRSFATQIRAKYPIASAIYVEDKANGPAVIDDLRSSVGGLMEFNVHDYGSKEARAHVCQPLLVGGNLYIPSKSIAVWVEGYVGELAAFPRGKNDDMNDSTTMALIAMMKYQYAESEMATGESEQAVIPENLLGHPHSLDRLAPDIPDRMLGSIRR